MERTNRNYAFVIPLIDALAELGLRFAVVAPGSRSTPLALAVADHPMIRTVVVHDERSAGFIALGAAKTTRTPVVVITTSGTAAAELLPAAIEARQGRVPLLLFTADRPPELRDVGAPQAIDQIKLYGSAVKWFHDTGTPEPSVEFLRTAPVLAARAWAAALDAPAGPVHLNFAFREPLVPQPGDAPEIGAPATPRYIPPRLDPDEATVGELAALVARKRAVIVAGPQDDPLLAPALAGLAATGRIPIVADAMSQVRAGTHDLSLVVATGNVLAATGFVDRLPPEIVIRVGAPPTSKALSRWLTELRAIPQVIIDPAGWRDPGGTVSTMVRADPTLTATALSKAVSIPSPAPWGERWRRADDAAAGALAASIGAAGFPTEPGVIAALARALPTGATLWAASSMPVRDVDTFLPRLDRPLRVLGNRGANGIDGFISTALGSALAGNRDVFVLAGDLALIHDLTALATAGRLGIGVTAIVIDNDGGGIFSFLPQASLPEFERLFAVPHGLDLPNVARALGVAAESFDDRAALEVALRSPPSGPRLFEIRTDRSANVQVHRRAQEAVERALAALDQV